MRRGVVIIIAILPQIVAQRVTVADDTVAEALRAWRSRQDRVRSAIFEWTESKTEVKHSYRAFATTRRFPDEDTTWKARASITLDGEKCRYAYEGQVFYINQHRYVPRDYVSVFDGDVCKLYTKQTAESEHGTGVIRPDKHNFDAETLAFRSLSWWLRPLHANSSRLSPDKLADTGRTARIEGVSCHEFEQIDGASGTCKLWLDPHRDWCVVRGQSVAGGEPKWQIDVAYGPDPQVGWVPRAWTLVSMAAGGTRLKSSTTATVEKYSINPRIGATEFDFDFAPGTVVVDDRTKEHYVVRHDGQERHILRDDYGASYDAIINSEPGGANHSMPSRSVTSSLPITIGLILGIVVAIALALRRSRRLPPD